MGPKKPRGTKGESGNIKTATGPKGKFFTPSSGVKGGGKGRKMRIVSY